MVISAEHERRDKAICCYAVRYRIVLPFLVSLLFFSRKQSNHILRKLTDAEWLQDKERKLPKGMTYYWPSARLCRERAAPKERGERQLREAALDCAIGVSVFCANPFEADGPRYYRLENWEASELVGKAFSANVVHLLGEAKVYRVYHALCGPSMAVKAIRTQIEKARSDSILRPWLTSRQYGFVVLVPTFDAVASTQRAFERAGLHDDADVVVGPTAATLHSCIREHQAIRETQGKK